MNIVILTQADPFFLADNIRYLLKNLPNHSKVVATVLFKVSPFGKKESFFQKALKSLKIFGGKFFFCYSLKFIYNKFKSSKSVEKVLKKDKIPIVKLDKGINNKNSLDVIREFHPDLLISIAGNQIFKKELINLAPKGCLNLHSALLPKYRGLMPSFWVLKNREKETGVSVFFVDEGIDSGEIIVQYRIDLSNIKSQADLIVKSKKMGMDAIIEAVDKIEKDNYTLIPNDGSEMTYFSFPTKEDVKEFRKKGNRFY